MFIDLVAENFLQSLSDLSAEALGQAGVRWLNKVPLFGFVY